MTALGGTTKEATMRWPGLLTLLFAGAAALLWAADDKKPDEPVKGFLVHEWGVWHVHDNLDLANADMRTQWDELPPFVYGQTTTRELPSHWDNESRTIILKPVLFLHAPRAMQAEVRVDFPKGMPAVWWPATEHPAYQGNDEEDVDRKKSEKMAKFLEWKLHLQQPLQGQRSPVRPLDKPHWMQALREVKCDDVYVSIGQRKLGMEHEKFVYYDGLLPRLKALSIKIDKEKVVLKNQEKYAVFDLWVVDNRAAGQPCVGRLPRLDAGASTELDLAPMRKARWEENAAEVLTMQLKDAGLNLDEAKSLVTIWTADFFRSAGVTLFYRVPQEEYDRLLPLTVRPRPEKIVRVGLVQQIPFDADFAERIAHLVKQLDNDDFDKREAAQRELEKLGPVAFGYLRRLQPTVTAPEAKRRLDQLLEKHDAQQLIKN